MPSTDRDELIDELTDTVEELTRKLAAALVRIEILEVRATIQAETKGGKKPPSGPKPWRIDEAVPREEWILEDSILKDQKIPGAVQFIPSPDEIMNDPRRW